MLNRIYSWIGWTLLALLLLVATAVALTRQFLPSIAEYKSSIELFLSEKTGSAVSIGEISAHWQGRYPVVQLRNVQASTESAVGPEINFSVQQLDAEVDLLASVFSRFPIFEKLTIEQTSARLYQHGGRWIKGSNQGAPENSSSFIRQIINVLTQQPEVSFTNARLSLFPEQGDVQQLYPITFLLNNSADQHYLYGSLALSLADAGESQVEFAIETESLPSDPLAGDYRLYAKVSDAGPQLLNMDLIELPFSVKKLDMGAELWGRWNNRNLESLQGALQIKQLLFEQDGLDDIADSALTFTLQQVAAQQFNLLISDLLVQNSTVKLVVPFISANIGWGNRSLALHQLSIKEIDLGMLSGWFLGKSYVPESLNDALEKLDSKGYLRNLTIAWPDSKDLSTLQGGGDLDQVSVGHYYGAPVLKNVTGRLSFTERTGSIDLDAQDFYMGFPSLFLQGWQYSKARGRVNWVIEERAGYLRPVVTINSGLLNVENSAIKAAGRFSMFLPLDRENQTELTLLIGVKNSDGRQASLYIPPEIVGESLHHWVSEAIQRGIVNDGMLLLRTGTRPLADREPPTVQLYFDVSGGDVKFQPDWPVVSQVDMTLRFDHTGFDIKAEQGQFLNSHASHIEVQLPAKSTDLHVKTTVAGEAGDILTLLRTTSLHEVVGKGLDEWSLTGAHETDVSVVVPLAKKTAPSVQVSSRITSGKFQNKTNNLSFTKVAGDIEFSSEKGLSSDNLSATMMNAALDIRIDPVAKTKEFPAVTRVYLAGKVGVEALKKQTSLSLLNSAQGSAAINARLDICSGSLACNKLVIDSDLQGVALQVPAPFGKEAGATLPLQVVGQVGVADSVWRYNLGDQLRGVTKAIEGASRTRLSFGGKRPQEPLQAGIWIDGELNEVDLEALKAFLMRNGWWGNQSLPSSQEGLQQLALHIQKIKAGKIQIEDVDLVVNTDRNAQTAIGIISPKVAGEIIIPLKAEPYLVNLEYLYLGNELNKDKPSTVDDKKETTILDTREWPVIDLSIKQLYLNTKPFGQWRMNIEPDHASQLTVKNIAGSFNSFKMTGEAGWRLLSNKPGSFMNMTLEGDDLGQLLGYFGYDSVIESDSTHMTSGFSWSGYPWEFEAQRLNGSFKMLLKRGRILETGDRSNILRLFGILNLNTIARRLQLNFTDLVKTGVAFDRVSAHYLLNQGVAYSQEPLTMDGPSANVNMQGSINLVEQTLDSQMGVVLPLTSNVPIAAVLLGAPQIAGAVFLLDKLIGDRLEKVSTLTYQLSGSWAEPEIKIINPGTAKPEQQLPVFSGDQ